MPSTQPAFVLRLGTAGATRLLCLIALLQPGLAAADYYDDIGFRQLQTLLGAAMPTGASVRVMHVEASQMVNGFDTWAPDPGIAEFSGKTITELSGAPAGLYTTHATTVGTAFYGNSTSIAPGTSIISVYSADDWVQGGFLRSAGTSPGQPLFSAARVGNHSWIGAFPTFDTDILERLDWVIGRDELVTVVGLNNGDPNQPLLCGAYNVISVGRTDGAHGRGTVAVDAIYTAGRIRPDLVAPAATTSDATPRVAAAASLLVQTGHANAGLSTDPFSQSVVNRAGSILGTVRNAERSEVIKAALMAGALRATANSSAPNIVDYRLAPSNQAANGLDVRFGAGQLNIRNSYQIIAAGEQNSLEDQPGGGGAVAASGFDYDFRFGGAAGTNNSTATYYLPVPATDGTLSVALVWNLKIAAGSTNNFDGTPTRFNLDLMLQDVTIPASPVTVVTSQSTTENTENIWQPILAGRQYRLLVSRPVSQAAFDWDFALAWHTDLVPAPDSDGDGVPDTADNCTVVVNADQLDANGDGYGNLCDGDLNNSGFVTTADFGLLRSVLGQPASSGPLAAAADMNGSGTVTTADFGLLRAALGMAPGPSGVAP